MRGFDGFSTHVAVEKVGDVEELVADDFGVEAGSRAACEESVVGVVVVFGGAGFRGLLVGAAGDEGFHEGFDVPAGVDELEGEVVEELGV